MKQNELYLPGLTPKHRISTLYCIGRNYAKHARELGNQTPRKPIVFIKPSSSVIFSEGIIQLPAQSSNIHHEVELVAAIGQKASRISEDNALDIVAGYGIGIDVTARDIQSEAKQNGHPWSIAKGFDTFAPISSFVDKEKIEDIQNVNLKLEVNGEVRQLGNTRDMIFPVAQLVSFVSSIFTLYPGDLLFTGTPEGVSQINHGDSIHAVLGNNIETLDVRVESKSF